MYGVAKGADVLIGAISVVGDSGVRAEGVQTAHSYAAKCIAPRRGPGEIKHADVRNMWIQDGVCSGREDPRRRIPLQDVTLQSPRPRVAKMLQTSWRRTLRGLRLPDARGVFDVQVRVGGATRCRPRPAESLKKATKTALHWTSS